MSNRPTTITVRDYYRQNFVLKVAKKECLVSVPGYAGSWIEDVEDAHGMYLIKFQDHDGVHSFNFAPDDKLTVTWLPIPPSRYADLLPQTVDTVRYGTPEFEQLAREDAEAEIARLQAINAKMYAFISSIESCDYSTHGDFVKACELLLWQEKAADLKAELDDSEPDHK